jgi:iron(III) transport system ATP-binding protein
MSAVLVRLREVTKRYGERPAVDRVSLEVRAGEVVVILGPSGCGKTTLLRTIAGLERPDDGSIWLDQREVAARGKNLVPPHRRGIGFVFQDLALWPHLTVRQHLDFVMGAAGVPKPERPAHARDVLALVRIEGLADRYPHQLSGGEQQRAALARAVITRPRLLLLDEPFSSLDPELRGALRTELIELQRSLGLTMIYVTHHPGDARALADRLISMRAGRIESDTTRAMSNTPSEVS